MCESAIVERHEAIVIGAGPAGLAAACMLGRAAVETLTLEASDAVGARWRTHYHGLRLNTMRGFSGLPGMRIPRRYGRYPSRDDFITYLEEYRAAQPIAVRFGTQAAHIDRASDARHWKVDTSQGPLLSRYVVVATGYNAVPLWPEWANRLTFTRELMHSSQFRSPDAYAGRDVIVVGAGNTGIDIAGLLIAAGARVSVAMRTPPNVFPRDWHSVPLEYSAIAVEHLPTWVGDTLGDITQRLIYGPLARYGLPRAPQGIRSTFETRSIGPAVDDGFIAALKDGRSRIIAPIVRFEGPDAVLADGSRLQPDVVICATGYSRGLQPLVGHLGVLRPNGAPRHDRAVPAHTDAPRLYFTGFYGPPSGQIRTMATQARKIARSVARDRLVLH